MRPYLELGVQERHKDFRKGVGIYFGLGYCDRAARRPKNNTTKRQSKTIVITTIFREVSRIRDILMRINKDAYHVGP